MEQALFRSFSKDLTAAICEANCYITVFSLFDLLAHSVIPWYNCASVITPFNRTQWLREVPLNTVICEWQVFKLWEIVFLLQNVCYLYIMWRKLCKFAALPSLFMLPSSPAGKLLHSSFLLLQWHMIKRETKFKSSENETNTQWMIIQWILWININEYICVNFTQPI